MEIDDEGGLSSVPISSDLITNMNTNHFKNNTVTGKIDINTNLAELKGPKGDTGKGWTGATYATATGILTFASDDALAFNTSDIRGGKGDKGDDGDDGTNGKGWTGATYAAGTGIVTFASNDGFGLTTGDLRGGAGANGKGWTGATYSATTGVPTFVSNDIGYAFTTGDLRGGTGANGKGWTGATYNATTGVLTFASNDVGYALTTGDLRGASGATITSTQLSALMNITDHFTLNGTTNKIDFKTTYKIPTAGTADTLANSRNIAGVVFNGSINIDIPYANLSSIPTTWTTTQIPTLAISKISGLQGVLDAKQNNLTSTTLDITATITPPNQPTTINIPTTYKPTTAGTEDTLANSRNIAGVAFNGSISIDIPYANLTNKLSQGTGISISAANPPVISATYDSANLMSIFNSIQFSNVNNLIQINSSYKPNTVNADTETKLATGKYISGVLFDGSSDVNLSYFGLTEKPWNVYPGQSTYLYFNQSGNVGIGVLTTAEEKLHVVGNIKASENLIAGMNLTVAGTSTHTGTSTLTGRVGIGKAPHATYACDVNGTLNATSLLVGGYAITGSKWTTGAVSTNIYYDAGNVGIGASTTSDVDDNTAFALPTARLYVKSPNTTGGTSDVVFRGGNAGQGGGKVKLWLMSDASHSSYIQNEHTGSGNTTLSFGTSSSNALPTERMTLNQAGDLFISSSRLVLRGNAPTLYLRDTDNRSGMIHMNGNIMYFLNANGNDSETWAQQNGQDWALQINMDNNTAKFGGEVNANVLYSRNHIYATSTIQASGAFYFANNTWHNSNEGENRVYYATSSTTYIRGVTLGRVISFRNGAQQDIAYFDNYIFWCYGPGNLSDRRIKRDIEEINDETALNMILLVQPTTYYYRDEARNKGNGKVYGFIAQQIKEVIPEAVMITKDIIANIYKTCLICNKREIYHSIPQDVAIDTEVRILDKEGGEKGKCYKIKEIHEDHFVIDEDIDGDECFVFGYCVDDLNGLDKTYIYTLNVCATQELHRRMEAQNVIIKSQEERIKELETKLEKLINYIYQ